ncbi:MAG: P-II family nitrogen regulator [Vampirovibrionales bacterium]|nr:P-II family nitrogen regulator [Vampirovibrionales bacterium]
MKRIEAIIKEENLDAVKSALDEAGFVGMTVFNCRGRGNSGGIDLEWRAGTYRVDFLHKIMLMLVVGENDVQKVVDIIIQVCQADETGGAGKIFISPVDEVIRIRTGERNEQAL